MSASPLEIDRPFLLETLEELLALPSPSGFAHRAADRVVEILEDLGLPVERTRRGVVRGTLGVADPGASNPHRALAAHLDTLGAMVTGVNARGRLRVAPIGSWPARSAEGARVTVLRNAFGSGDPRGERPWLRGTLLPEKASAHVAGSAAIDSQPAGWKHLELRLDAPVDGPEAVRELGISVGDPLAVDSGFEHTDTGFLVARHLDDKAGAAVILAVAEAFRRAGASPAVPCQLVFTVAEEVGTGGAAALGDGVAELVVVDNGIVAPDQATLETGVTLGIMDSSGPFDRELTGHLLALCREADLPHSRDVFHRYSSDGAAVLKAGADLRVALATFGVDASHGWERTHEDALLTTARLLTLYLGSPVL